MARALARIEGAHAVSPRGRHCGAGSGAACLELASQVPAGQQRPLRERACQRGRPEACTRG